jgi:hypothetical protein
MNTTHNIAWAGLLTILLTGQAWAQIITKAEYEEGKTRINAAYDQEKKACSKLSGNQEDVCKVEAKANREAGLADLDASLKGTLDARISAEEEKVNGIYDIAKEKCDDYNGDAKDLCLTKAKADRNTGMANVKANRKTMEARQEAAEKKMESDYEVALKKCDSYAGNVKDSCKDKAKADYRQ